MYRLFRVMVVSLSLSLSWTAPAFAVDFSGTWALDVNASGSMDPILELQGVSWARRKLAERLDARVRITQVGDRLTAVYDNVLGKQEQVLVFDGMPHETVNPAGIATTFSTSWRDGETRLVSSGPCTSDEGATSTLTETRTLSADGMTLTLMLQVSTADGRKASATRILRKAP